MKVTVSIGKEIEILREELNFEERKLARLQKQSAPSEINGNTSYVDADSIHGDHHKEAMTEIQEIAKCHLIIRALKAEIEECETQLDRIYDRVLSLENTDEKVVIFRDVYGKKITGYCR